MTYIKMFIWVKIMVLAGLKHFFLYIIKPNFIPSQETACALAATPAYTTEFTAALVVPSPSSPT